MRGLTDKALFIMPKMGTYDSRNLDWQLKLNDSVRKMRDYLRKNEIEPYFLFTDELSHLHDFGIKHISPVLEGDVFFIKNNVDGFGGVNEPTYPDDKEPFVEFARKYPVERSMNQAERFNVLLKREKRGVKHLQEQFKVIVSFQHPNNPAFKLVNSEEGDGRLVIKVNHVTMSADAYFGGMQVPLTQLTQEEQSLSPIYSWEV